MATYESEARLRKALEELIARWSVNQQCWNERDMGHAIGKADAALELRSLLISIPPLDNRPTA